MQERGLNNSMDGETEGQTTPPQSRGRNNSKLKVLVRSHAMREEASPPREPTPTPLCSPCIKLTPSSDSQPPSPNKSFLALSPSVSRGNSPSRTPNISPTHTLVPSPTRYSPQLHSPELKSEFTDFENSPKINKLNRQNLERFNNRNVQKTDIIVEESSQIRNTKCDCPNQNCIKCQRNQDRNYNNNLSSSNNNNNLVSPNTLTVSRSNMRGKLRQQSSSQGSFEELCASTSSPSLSRDNSSEQYRDQTGVDLELFIPETLNRNGKDRSLMLRIEQELVNLAKDKMKTHYKFPPMSSYQRMLVHRCAAYFGMDHNIESSGKCVVVNKTKNTRIPDVEFRQHVKEDIVFSEEPRRSILKRDSNSIEDYNFKSPDRQNSMENRRSKSFEEREEEYEKVRRRIFNKEMQECGGSVDDLAWAEMQPWSSTDSETLSRFRMPSEYPHRGRSTARLLKVQSEETGEETLRPCVAKSYSFGGYGGVLTRGDSVMSTHSAGPRLLTKQDSAASSVSWRLSPSSSGYKTQSQRSESVTPSPTSTPFSSGDPVRQDSTTTNASDIQQYESDSQVVWAVTNINSVPKGSVIINPQSGQPVKNEDGSLYHYDPQNPPPAIQTTANKPPPSPTKIASPQKTMRDRPISPKKRSRSSPIKKSIFINSSTSPSLPYTPPLPPNRTYPIMQSSDALPPPVAPQQYPVYGPPYSNDGNIPMYQQPCIVYAPYGTVPVQYDRLEPQVSEVPTYYNLQESMTSPVQQPMTYQAAVPSVWNQQPLTYYPNTSPNGPSAQQPQRYALPLQPQNPYISPYQSNYVPHQPPQNSEILPVYQQQPIQMIYPAAHNQPNPVMYPNQNIIYTQPNPVYQNPVYPPQNISYPPNTPTPGSCSSSVSNPTYCGPFDQNLGQMMQHMNQMTIASQNKHMLLERKNSCGGPKGNKFSIPKNYGMSPSQSSTETNSPAMTVVTGYCPNQGVYRTTSDTPPASHIPGGNFISPMLIRQMNNVRASPPVINRSSRSPTPASDMHLDRQRFAMPPTLYQGMPYVLQSDTRIVPGRGQPSAYREPPLRPQNYNNQGYNNQGYSNQAPENKSNKNRKPRGFKTTTNLPPNGKH